jgi:hypothetical protein
MKHARFESVNVCDDRATDTTDNTVPEPVDTGGGRLFGLGPIKLIEEAKYLGLIIDFLFRFRPPS